MKQYLDALDHIMKNGVDREGRNGWTRSSFAIQMRFNLEEGFPAVTTKKLAFKSVLSELIWFIEGSNDERRLAEILYDTRDSEKKTIWTANAEADYWKSKAQFEGDLGRVYGVQWRDWTNSKGEKIDQLADVIERIKTNPYDRRLIVSAWNPGELDQMALPPCHRDFQFYVAEGTLSLHMNQRSCDMFLGVPFNIASYSILLSMIAQVTDLTPHEAVFTFNDAHIYHDHFDAVKEQLTRTPDALPALWLNKDIVNINDFTMKDVKLENYSPQETIKAPMAV
ncbi:MAG: thymidylate synthase [Parcubacteria group bacterium]|mgnify:CR=1 FL=1|nr:thymidylate synthase [Parcubacteria group bacterium]|tara:strand:- start:3240 stop:4082 length:843 start_codon:yes stop_codon:yes gene_type:complete